VVDPVVVLSLPFIVDRPMMVVEDSQPYTSRRRKSGIPGA